MLDRSIYTPSPWSLEYHACVADKVLGGGSAGPGKSLTLLFDPIVSQATIEHARMTGQLLDQFPEYLAELCRKHPIRKGESEGHALHMRRSMPQLLETIDRSMRMFPKFDPGAEYSKERHSWTFSSGYKYTFGHCREDNSHEDYLSKQYTYLGLDEAYQFLLKQYEELDGRVRSADPVLRYFLRTRLMSNPAPGWLKEMFVDPNPDGREVLIRVIRDPDKDTTRNETRVFLPAKLDDNPDKDFVLNYKFKLLGKPAHMRARYLYGDWNAMEGGFFEDDFNSSVHVVEPYKIPRDWPKFRAMDWGFKTYGTTGWLALDPDENLILFFEFNFKLMKDAECADRHIDIERQFGFWNEKESRSRLSGVADTQLWEKRGDSGKSKAEVFSAKGVFWQPADKSDKAQVSGDDPRGMQRGAERIIERLRDYDKDKPPGLMIFKNCKKTIEMLAAIQIDENDSTVPDKNSQLKHWFDMLRYACTRASRGRGSIVMELHEFDRQEEDDEPVARSGSWGYGTA